MSKIWNFIKKKKVLFIIIAVILIAAVVVTCVFVKKSQSKDTGFTYTRTVTLSKGSLQDTIVASGTIESRNTSTVTASGNAQVSKINYSVGDYVEEGDVIIELDKTSINKQISKAQKSVNESYERLEDSYNSAVSSKDEIWSNWNASSKTLASAETAYKDAKSKVESYEEAYNQAYAQYKEETEALLSVDGCTITNGNPINCGETDAYTTAKSEMEKALSNLNTIKSTTNYETLKKEYETALSNNNNLYSQLSSANSKVADAYESLEEGVSSDNLSDLYDSLEDYELTAKTTGQITSMNAVVGSGVNGTLATIQDTSKLKISLTIDEYDIFSVALGQKALIETDASDNIYEGEVSQISPVASGGMGSSGFEIEVKVTSEDVSKLLIGMSAEVTIIITESEENFTVPVDAVESRMDGTKVIYVEDENGEFYEVSVTTGNDNGYYIEIFGDELYEGMKVRASANADEAMVMEFSDEAISEEGFSFGFGGVMPSGGGDFSGGGGNAPSGGGDMPSGGGGGNMPSGGFGGN